MGLKNQPEFEQMENDHAFDTDAEAADKTRTPHPHAHCLSPSTHPDTRRVPQAELKTLSGTGTAAICNPDLSH